MKLILYPYNLLLNFFQKGADTYLETVDNKKGKLLHSLLMIIFAAVTLIYAFLQGDIFQVFADGYSCTAVGGIMSMVMSLAEDTDNFFEARSMILIGLMTALTEVYVDALNKRGYKKGIIFLSSTLMQLAMASVLLNLLNSILLLVDRLDILPLTFVIAAVCILLLLAGIGTFLSQFKENFIILIISFACETFLLSLAFIVLTPVILLFTIIYTRILIIVNPGHLPVLLEKVQGYRALIGNAGTASNAQKYIIMSIFLFIGYNVYKISKQLKEELAEDEIRENTNNENNIEASEAEEPDDPLHFSEEQIANDKFYQKLDRFNKKVNALSAKLEKKQQEYEEKHRK